MVIKFNPLSFYFLYPLRYFLGGRYIVSTANGDLYVRSVRAEDGLKRFSCMTINSLTGERKSSDSVLLSVRGEYQNDWNELNY